MYTRNNNKMVVVIALCVAVIGLSIGFAALSTTLTINGSATVVGSSWTIKFANVTSSSTKAAGLSTNPTMTVPTITNNTTLGTFSCELRGPGDSCIIEFDIINTGNYNAKITSLTGVEKTCGTSAICNNIDYILTYVSDGGTVRVNDRLTSGQTKRVRLYAGYKTSATTVNTGSVINVNTSPITIIYSQV